MIRKLLLLAAAMSAAACSNTPTKLGSGLSEPAAIVAYRGYTTRRPELQTYVAVASERGSELRILDPREDRPILGPTLVFPLSVPTDARPLRLAAASLADVDANGAAVALPDLLAVASPGAVGGPSVEIVNTWTSQTRIAQQLPLPADAEILSLAAAPTPGQPGHARLVAGIATSTGGALAVFDVRRGDGGAVVFDGTAPALRPLVGTAGEPFDPRDLAFSPAGDLLFVATTDVLGGTAQLPVRGVAQLAVAGDPATWTLTALDARDGTTHVMTANVIERSLTNPADPNAFDGPARLLVYATLDPEFCGDAAPIRCGIATLVPGSGLAEDPVLAAGAAPDTAMPYRAPMETFGLVSSLSSAGAPTAAPQGWQCPGLAGPLATVQLSPPGPGLTCSTAVGVATSSDGNAYVMDLGRFQVPSLVNTLAADVGTRVTSVVSSVPVGATGTPLTLLDANGDLITKIDLLPSAVLVTPGITPTETFQVTWQGALPGLIGVRGVVVRTGASTWVVAGQESSGSSTGTAADWILGTRLAMPAVGIAPADIVQISPVSDLDSSSKLCPADASGVPIPQETTVTRVVPATEAPALLPGGGIEVAATDATCWASGLAVGQARSVTFNVRASGLVLAGSSLGYLGRPQLHVTGSADPAVRYVVQYSRAADEPTPEAARALDPVSAEQAIARKARRRFYTSDLSCGDAGVNCERYGIPYPFAPGPLVALTVGTYATPPRDATLTISTASGYSAWVTRPSGAVLPLSSAPVDRSVIPGSEKLGFRWYVAYSDDQVFVFGPAETPNQAFSIR